MKKLFNTKGTSIIEVIVAIGIFIMVASNVVVLALGSYSTTLRDLERLQADMYLQQGFEAARSIKDYSFSGLTNGSHGLSRTSGYWAFSGGSDTQGQFTRTITIADVQRNSSCVIVESGGDVYGSTKKITTTINWDLEEGNSTSVSATQYLSDWKNPTNCGEEADSLGADGSSAYLSNGNKQLKGLTLENTGGSDIDIDKITVTWDNSEQIEEIQIDGTPVWKSSGVGTPAGKQSSGTELDIENYTLIAGTTVDIDTVKFDTSMSDATFSITFTLVDGSASTISGIQP